MPIININNRELSEQTVMEIGKFTILWNIFEKEKCRLNCNSRKIIQLTQNATTNKHWQDLANALQMRTQLVGNNTRTYVNERLSQGYGIRRDDDKEQIIEFIDSEGRKSLAGGLLAIYRIRNNMFHGLKDWTELDSQIELFVKLNEFLTYTLTDSHIRIINLSS